MKILWVINIMLPDIAKSLKRSFSVREGWLSGIFNEMTEEKSEYELYIAYPVDFADAPYKVVVKGVECYSFYEDLSCPECYDSELEGRLERIIGDVKPDILHVFGTEFPHALAALRVFNNPKRALIGMQGVVSEIAVDYMAKLPDFVVNSKTFRDILKRDSLKQQQEKFFLRGKNEIEALSLVDNITGRTSFDRKFTHRINPSAEYFYMGETMRDIFYEGKWSFTGENKHRIFIGQADYPIKGMHFLIEAAGMLLTDYPDLEIVFAGNSIIKSDTLKSRLKTSAYGKYLRKLIRDNRLEGKIISLGNLDKDRMKEEYLSCSVFVCASYIENSPNTVAEAMLLGVPLVASNAGGIPDIISDEEGLIFERGDVNKLAQNLRQIFEEEETDSPILKQRIEKEIIRAKKQYTGVDNYRTLLDIYSQISIKE